MTGYIIIKSLKKKHYRNIGIILQLTLGSLIMTLALSNYRFYEREYEAEQKIITPNVYKIDIFPKKASSVGADLTSSFDGITDNGEKSAQAINSIVEKDANIDKIGKGFDCNLALDKSTDGDSQLLKSSRGYIEVYSENKELTEMCINKVKKGMDFAHYFASEESNSSIVPMLVSEAVEKENPIGSVVTLPEEENTKFKIIGVLDEKYPILDQLYSGKAAAEMNGLYYCVTGGLFNSRYSFVYVKLKDGVNVSEAKKSFVSNLDSSLDAQFATLKQFSEGNLVAGIDRTAKPIFYGIIILILSTFGVISIVLASLLKRKRELGIRIAAGASKKHIIEMITGEIACLFIFSQIISIVITALMSFINDRRIFDLKILGISSSVIIILLVISLIPIFIKVLRMKPIDLIYEWRG